MQNNRYCGNVSDFAPVSEDQSRVVIMYGLNPTEGEMAEWYQIEFYKKQGKPSFEQVKAAIIADINERGSKSVFKFNLFHFYIISLFKIRCKDVQHSPDPW